MQEFYEFTQQFGVSSLDFFWFPLGIWTVVSIFALLTLRAANSLNPLYHYHLRVATLFAIPLGFLTKYVVQFLSLNSAATSAIDSTFFVVTNPIDLGVNSVSTSANFVPNLTEPNFLIGLTTIIVFTISYVLIIRFLKSLFFIRKLNDCLNLLPITSFEGFCLTKYSNVKVAYLEHPMVPFTFGWKNPVIVLPKSIQDDPEKIRMAIQHELVHIKRGDYLLQLILSLIESVFWFHPIIRYGSKEIEIYREISCDQEVLNTTGISLKKYAAMLYELIPLNRGFGSFSVSMAVHQSTLKKRISTMKYHKLNNNSIKRSILFFLLISIGIITPIACSDMRAPVGLSEEEIENLKMSLINTSITINGVDVSEGNESGGVRASGHYALFLHIPKYGVFKFAPTNFEGGTQTGFFDGNSAIFTINSLTVEIESPTPILSIDGEVELWAKHYPTDVELESIGTGAARIDYSIEQFLDESIIYSNSETLDKSNSTSDLLKVVDQMPKLIGGLAAIQSKIIYPERARKDGIEGRVVVQFIVTETGNVENPQIIRGIGAGCDEVALEAVKQAKFEPGLQKGEPVRVQFSMPIIFRLQDSDFTGSNDIHTIKPENDWTMGEFFASIDSVRSSKD